MLNIYITEENKLVGENCSCMPFLSSLCYHVKKHLTFSNEETFKGNISLILEEMLQTDSEDINLLIISAHGNDYRKDCNGIKHDGGRGRVELNKEECLCLDLRSCEGYFAMLPKHLVVFLSMCQGAYPGPYEAFYESKKYKPVTERPILIASIVKIYFQDLHDFLKMLIEALKSSSDDEDEILRVINQFNTNVKEHYDFDDAIWMSDRSGKVSVPWGQIPIREVVKKAPM